MTENDKSGDISLVGCCTCGRSFPQEDMHKFDLEIFPAYVCEDCQQRYQEKWEEKHKEPK